MKFRLRYDDFTIELRLATMNLRESSRGGSPVPASEDSGETRRPAPKRVQGIRVCSICQQEGHNCQKCPMDKTIETYPYMHAITCLYHYNVTVYCLWHIVPYNFYRA